MGAVRRGTAGVRNRNEHRETWERSKNENRGGKADVGKVDVKISRFSGFATFVAKYQEKYFIFKKIYSLEFHITNLNDTK